MLQPRLFDPETEYFTEIPAGTKTPKCRPFHHKWVAFVTHDAKQRELDRIIYCERCGIVKRHTAYNAVLQPVPWWEWRNPKNWHWVAQKRPRKPRR